MKKTLSIIALAAALCSCEKQNGTLADSGYGYIDLGLTADSMIETKAAASVGDLSGWTIKVGETAYTSAGQKIAAGTYTLSASNYADEAAAIASNSGWGDAFYSGSTANVTVTAGETTEASIACGTAKNARLAVVFALGSDFTEYKVTVAKEGVSGGLVFDAENASTSKAYFTAGKTGIGYSIDYKYKGTAKNITGKTINLGGAATEKTIRVASNSNGTITITVTRDEEFGDGGSENITIDAVTGDEVSNS